MIKVKQRENEPVGVMIKRFKKLCEKEGLTKDIKRAAVYEKPSEKKRRTKRRGPMLDKKPLGSDGPGGFGPSSGPAPFGRPRF